MSESGFHKRRNLTSLSCQTLLALVACLCLCQKCESGIISAKYGKYAATGSFGGDGGPASEASLKWPYSVWINSMSESFIADYSNYRVRKVDTTGIISTYIGGTTVLSDGPATATASFASCIYGDSVGNIYANDSNMYLRKIDSNLIVATIAGGGSLGSSDFSDNGAPGTAVSLNTPFSILVDTQGDVYLANSNHRIEKFTVSTGIITYAVGTGVGAALFNDTSTYNGDGGPATSAIVTYPMGLYMDTNNAIYFCSGAYGHIRKVDMVSGIVTNFAGGSARDYGHSHAGDGGPATSALLVSQGSLTGDASGTIFYSEWTFSNVRVIDTSGIINRFAGPIDGSDGYSGDGGDATAAMMKLTRCVMANGNYVYICDTYNNVIRSVDALSPTAAPVTSGPSVVPSRGPTVLPSTAPTVEPTLTPSEIPTEVPSLEPTVLPTIRPTRLPTIKPSRKPTNTPTVRPTAAPTVIPTLAPSEVPTVAPSDAPTAVPTIVPSALPTVRPTTIIPSRKPSAKPTVRPTRASLSVNPTARPSVAPTLASVVISFNSDIVLGNVTATSLDQTGQSAVTSAVAMTLNISTDQVTFVSQSQVGEGRRVLRVYEMETAVHIMVTVNVMTSTQDVADAVSQNGSYLYRRLFHDLMDAVANGDFSSNVRKTSAALGARATLYVGDVNVTVAGYREVPSSVHEVHHHHLSVGDYAGIVIGIIVSFLFIIAVYYYFRSRGGEGSSPK